MLLLTRIANYRRFCTEGKGKGKKSKGQKLDIDEFVDTNNFKMVDSSWADIMEDEDVIVPQHHSLPSAPKSALGPEVDLAAVPTIGPYKAHVTNLQYEVTEDQLTDLFKGLSVSVIIMCANVCLLIFLFT